MKSRRILAVLLILCLGTGLVHAATTINISSFANQTWCPDFGNCSTLPFGKQTYNGIPFLIPGNANGTADNVWWANVAAGGGSSTVSITIPVNVAKVKTVYTLMNTTDGSTESGLLSITFTGSGGATWTVDPIGNINIRDYNNGSYTDSIACHLPGIAGSFATINAWTNGADGQRLDEQIYELPSSFKGQTLVSVTITDSGAPGVQRSFIAALTVSTALP
ncbi:MAG: hypothetical protein WCB56_14410 [Terriglobales bacterium]|jgi:hypothetical protein